MWLQILPSLSQALATFAGAVFVLIGIWYRDQLENKSKARNAKVQIVAEVQALIDLIHINNYLPRLREIIADRKNGGDKHFYFPSGRSFTSVYEANLSNLGMLEESASDVVRFYMIINSAVEDKDTIAVYAKMILDLREQNKPRDLEMELKLLNHHETVYGKLSSAVQIGEKLVEELRLDKPKSRKVRRPTPASTVFKPKDFQSSLDGRLVGVGSAAPASAHQEIQQ